MSAAQDRTRETLPDIPDEAVTAGDTDQVSAVRDAAQRPVNAAARIEVGTAFAAGPAREWRQDVLDTTPELGLAVVADGVGGGAAGSMAAQHAMVEVSWFLDAGDPDRTPPSALDVTQGLAAGLLVRAVEKANRVVHGAGLNTGKGMAAALAALLVAGPRVVVAHVGDVRVYRFRGGGLEKLTEDHRHADLSSPWQGSDVASQDPRPARRGLTQALGVRPTVRVGVRVEEIGPGDLFLLCSDGLWGCLTHDVMALTITGALGQRGEGGLRAAAKALVERAQRAGGTDDVTAVLVRPVRAASDGERPSPWR